VIIQDFEKQTTLQNGEIFVSDEVLTILRNCFSSIERHQINIYQAKELKKSSSALWNICVEFGKKENRKSGDWLAKCKISNSKPKYALLEVI
jgi:hypothetical protein